ncbi:hypothetical protein J437_LFUL002641 [Ladona fulva]|uniref:RRM domain-containing protein n=1 Tax=Ladona fulva TaxID=123851 RepID=A0A8K0JVG0_LADFU|nr:hypothetical protein J437_LFUL002641 [Ladona fulva]
MVKSGGLGGGSFASSASTMPGAPSKPPTSPPLMPRGESKEGSEGPLPGQSPSSVSGGTGGMSMPQPQRMPRVSRGGGLARGALRERGTGRGSLESGGNSSQSGSSSWMGNNSGNWNSSGDGDRRRSGSIQQYSDSQQLFMGNLPLHAGENDLRELFGKFGTILELRIHSKQNAKGATGKCVPNYGFIVFKDPASVQEVLGKRKLNLEEKKNRRPEGGGVNNRMGSGDLGRGTPRGIIRGSGMIGMQRGRGGMGGGGGPSPFTRGEGGRGGGMNRGGYTRR